MFFFRHLETGGCFRVEHMGGRGGRGLRRKRLGRQRERPWQRQQVNFISYFFFQYCFCLQQINIGDMHFYINTISEVIVGAEVVVIGVPTGVGEKEGGEADSGKWQMFVFRY